MSRRAIIAAMLVSSALVAAPVWLDYRPALIWNASASAPIGLYRLAPTERLNIGDYVVVAPPEPLAAFLAERGYLPLGLPLIKRVLARPASATGSAARCPPGRAVARSSTAKSSS